MKQKQEIQKEINDLISNRKSFIADGRLTREGKQANARIIFLNKALQYLETEPREEFIRKEIDRINGRLNRIEDLYKSWQGEMGEVYASDAHRLKRYNEIMEVAQMKRHLKTLMFLIG